MGIVIKQGIRNTVITYLGVLIGAINLLYIFPKLLKPEEIGLSRVLIDIALILASFAQLGAGSITDKFFPFFKDENQKHRGFFVLLLVYPLFGFILVACAFLFFKELWIESYQQKSPLLLNYYYHIIPLTFFVTYQQLLEAYCRAHFKIVVPGFIREVYLRVFLMLIVLLFFFKWIDLDQLVILLVISYGTAVLILFSYIKFLKKLFLATADWIKDKALQKEMLTFSFLIIFTSAIFYVATKVDVLFLSSMNGLASTGIYSIAFYIGTIIEIPKRSISQISTPLISLAWKNKDMSGIESLYKKSSLNQLIVGGFLLLLIWCNVDFILAMLPNSEIYKAGKYVILFIGLSRFIDMSMGVNVEIIGTSPYYKFNFVLTLFSGIFGVLCNYFLIQRYGMNGAAVSTLFNVALLNLIRFFYIRMKVKIQPFTKQSLGILGLAVLTYLITIVLPDLGNGFVFLCLNIFLRSILISILFIGAVFFFRFSEDFNNIVLKGLRKGRT